jgi:hypothetical protein
MQQKLFDHGAKSDVLCKILLQSRILFRKEFQSIDNGRAMQLAFDALGDFVALDNVMRPSILPRLAQFQSLKLVFKAKGR